MPGPLGWAIFAQARRLATSSSSTSRQESCQLSSRHHPFLLVSLAPVCNLTTSGRCNAVVELQDEANHTNARPHTQTWPSHALRKAAIMPLHATSNHLITVIMRAGSTTTQFRGSLYETLCANPDLPDAIALPALESFHAAHNPRCFSRKTPAGALWTPSLRC
jgi:hypothetical protein